MFWQNTPLHLACKAPLSELGLCLVFMLLQYGANPLFEDVESNTALHILFVAGEPSEFTFAAAMYILVGARFHDFGHTTPPSCDLTGLMNVHGQTACSVARLDPRWSLLVDVGFRWSINIPTLLTSVFIFSPELVGVALSYFLPLPTSILQRFCEICANKSSKHSLRLPKEGHGEPRAICHWEGCFNLTHKRCSACMNAFYCCRDHQRRQWKVHKLECTANKKRK